MSAPFLSCSHFISFAVWISWPSRWFRNRRGTLWSNKIFTVSEDHREGEIQPTLKGLRLVRAKRLQNHRGTLPKIGRPQANRIVSLSAPVSRKNRVHR